MSNKQVPAVYRSIITDVIESVRQDFDEVGVEDAVLQALLVSWESKVAQSRVADFSSDPRMGALAKQFPPQPINLTATPAPTASGSGAGKKKEKVKEEKVKEEGKEEEEEKEKDEDEINSDLDDDDDEDGAEGEGDDQGDLIIALYEKVQRVKNKWKITLKDGIVSVGGKEYLFNKCSGEFEW